MAKPLSPLLGRVFGYLGRLRFPTLLTLTATLFVVDVVIPDGIPFADEVFLGLLSALFASWKRRKEVPEAAPQEEGN